MVDVSLAGDDKLVIPFLTEGVDEGLLEELIEADVFCAAGDLGTAAYFPSVIVDSCKGGILFESHRV